MPLKTQTARLRQGTKALKTSQVYPKRYGKQVASLHLSFIVAWMPHVKQLFMAQRVLLNLETCSIRSAKEVIPWGNMSQLEPRQKTKERYVNISGVLSLTNM